jgi:hypothetical protein
MFSIAHVSFCTLMTRKRFSILEENKENALEKCPK